MRNSDYMKFNEAPNGEARTEAGEPRAERERERQDTRKIGFLYLWDPVDGNKQKRRGERTETTRENRTEEKRREDRMR
jgi:hypothetical protein